MSTSSVSVWLSWPLKFKTNVYCKITIDTVTSITNKKKFQFSFFWCFFISVLSLQSNILKVNHKYYTNVNCQEQNTLVTSLPPNTPVSLLGFDFSTERNWSLRVIRWWRESAAGLSRWALMAWAGLSLGWLVPVFFRGLATDPLAPTSPTTWGESFHNSHEN